LTMIQLMDLVILFAITFEKFDYCVCRRTAAMQARTTMQRVKPKEIFLFFLNNDAKLAPNAVAELVTALLQDPMAAIAVPRITDYEGTMAGVCGMGLDIFGYPCAPAAGEPFFYADGAAFVMRHDVFEALGGFDEDDFMFYEKTDLS